MDSATAVRFEAILRYSRRRLFVFCRIVTVVSALTKPERFQAGSSLLSLSHISPVDVSRNSKVGVWRSTPPAPGVHYRAWAISHGQDQVELQVEMTQVHWNRLRHVAVDSW
jgi:hypothetical protein